VLVVSTDPAHSLGDALDVKLVARPRTVARNLAAAELDAKHAFARWIDQHRTALGDALEHGTWLDRADVDALLDLSLPGIDELVGVLEIARLAKHQGHQGHKGHKDREGRDGQEGRERRDGQGARSAAPYDLIVVDTAPTGHTLRLLVAPATVGAIADLLDALQAEHRAIRERFARAGRPEAADRLIEVLAGQASEIGTMLRDPRQTTFCWVTLPEALSLAESEDGVGALENNGMRAAQIVVNRVLPTGGPCPVCDRRRADESRVIEQIRTRLGRGRMLRTIPADVREPRGVKRLSAIADRVIGDVKVVDRRSPDHPIADVALSLPDGAPTVSLETLDAIRGVTLLFVGGKGGVGKTTVSAAIAVRLAQAHPKRRVLLLSTDPAHSLADVFAVTSRSPAAPRSKATSGSRAALGRGPNTIGDTPATLRGGPSNLFVRELDAAQALAARRVDLEKALDEIAESFGAGDVTTTAVHTSELMDLAPPGIDELFGMLEVIRLIGAGAGEYDVIIVDTAPTGHALRLLEMPAAAREWVQVLLRMLLKYKSLVRPGQVAAELVEVSKSIRALQELMRDATRTRFLVVTRAAAVPRLETERLLDRLRRQKLAAPAVIVNAMTLAPRRCRRCRAVAAAERTSFNALRRRCGTRSRRCAIIQTPLSAPPPRGIRALESWGRSWILPRD
jgi:arsenite/tail-anchored protein-transporting ATPase